MGTLVLAMLSLALLAVSAGCLYYKKSFLGSLGGIAAMALTYVTCCGWVKMLADSGKNTALLGFARYPAAVILLAALMLASLVITIVNIVRMVRRNISK